MRARGVGTAACVALLASCAAISGLGSYSSEPCSSCDDSGADAVTPATLGMQEDASEDAADGSTSPGEDTPSPPLTTGGDLDAGSSEDATRAGQGSHDAAPPLDTGTRPPDAAGDAPSCNATSCAGCCTSQGQCAAGGLASACGTGGVACQDCETSELACVSGACAQPPADSGGTPSGCDPTTCTNLCVPYFIQCCKSDDTCGCALLFPRGSCN